MTPPIFAVCAEDPAVTALLGVDPVRLFPFGQAPQGVARPYAVWQVINGAPENTLADRPDIDGWALQVDVYAASVGDVRAVINAIRDAIELKAHIVRWGGEDRDKDTGDYHSDFDVDWLVHR